MSPPTANVRRRNPQALRFPGVTLCYQLYPGVHGRDADRGIANVHYAVYIDSRLWQNGDTGPDGQVSIPLPSNVTSFDIEIFGVRTTYQVVDGIAAATLPPTMQNMQGGDTDPAFVGLSQRLTLLGYMNAGSSGQNNLDEALDWAIVSYQVNEGFTPDGVLSQDEVDQLKTRTVP
jgi:hypothetical protein